MKSIFALLFSLFYLNLFAQNNAVISSNQTTICKNGIAMLSSSNSLTNDSPISFSVWYISGPSGFSFTDTTFVNQDLMIVLPFNGYYSVSLVNEHEDFSISSTQETNYLHVYEVNASFTDILMDSSPDVSDFHYCPPVVGNFTNTSTSIYPLQNFQWSFTNQNLSFNHIIDISENPNGIQFLYPGNIDFQLIVLDSNQCSDTIFIQYYLVISGPIAECHYAQTGNSNFMEYNFSVSNLENVASLEWHLGNGEIINDLDGFIYTYSTSGIYDAYVDATDLNGCQVRYLLGEISSGTNTLSEINQNTPKIYPNPSSDFINIKNINSEISINDINGKEISKNLYSVIGNQIDIRNLDFGMYFLILNGESYKFIKI